MAKKSMGTKLESKKPSVAADLISGFRELRDALRAGGDIGNKFTCYQLELDLQAEPFTPKEVRETRRLLSASQAVFAMFLGVSVKTVSEWEQGRSTPQDIACRFMDEIRRNPDFYRKRLEESAKPKRRKQVIV